MVKGVIVFIAVLLTGLFFIAPVSSFAADESAAEVSNKWQFEFTPYFFASSLNGKSGMNGVTADVDMSFSEILENLDSGFMAVFEARKGLWIFGFEGVYFKLENEKADSWEGPLGNTNTGDLEATMSEQLYQASAGYRMIDESVKVDMLGSFRTTILKADLDLARTTGSPLLSDGSSSVSHDEIWVDPIMGVRFLVPLIWNITAVGYAEIGGFGVGSDVTWQLLGALNWQFSSVVSAKFGYRCLYQDYEDNGFVWDMTASGFYLGAGFNF